MEIRLFCAYISCCVLLLTYLEAKTVSLNDIIAAERAVQHTTRRSTLLYNLAGAAIPAYGRKSSPLKHRQTYQIPSPSKPRKFNIIQKSRLRRKNLSKKREISHNEGIIQKYIPLLKNIRLLVDNILTSESSETYTPTENKYQRNLLSASERDDVVCTCGRKSNSGSTLRPQEKAITSTPPAATEIQNATVTIAATTQAYSTVNDNIRRIGRNKIVPVLSERNTTGIRGNNSRFGQRGSSAYNGSFEGYITGNNGNNEHNTRQETRPYTEDYEEHTDSYPRNDAGRDRSSERLRRIGIESRVTEPNRETGKVEESTLPGSETFEGVTRNLYEHERETEYEIRRDETESSLSVPEFGSGLRGFDSQEKDTAIRSTEFSAKSVTENSASDKRFFDRSGSFTTENQGVSAANEAVAPKHILPNSTYPVGKVVMIFDGYSVAKDVNGANKLTEKAIQIHT